MAQRQRRPRMTADEATGFDRYSVASMMQVQHALDGRKTDGTYSECTCQPYADTFTFKRWIAQGYCVRRGEKALKIGTFCPTGKTRKEQAEDGSEVDQDVLRPVTACLFCRCQVDKLPTKEVRQ